MPARLRVAFVDQVGATAGGAERNLAIFLAQARATIEPVAILFEDGDFANELRALGIGVSVVAATADLANATRESGGLAALRSLPLAVGRTVRLLRTLRPGLVYTNSMKAHFIGGLAARIAGIPCVPHFHDLYAGRPRAALRALAKFVSRERIACSELVAADMHAGRTNVIYGPVDVAAYAALPERVATLARLGVADDLPIVALIGRINRWKGHDRFLRIAARVNAKIPARFLIAGAPIFRDADFVPELHALARDLALGDRLQFVPWIDDVRELFGAIALNANCSTREPFGRTIPEAAAAGVATVCFADSGAAETVLDGVTGRTIAPGDEAAFADAIVEYLSDLPMLAKTGAAARDRARMFDAPEIAAQTLAVIERCARR